MGKLIYAAITSLDGFVADEKGSFDWAMPDEEVHTFINELERSIGTYLYGRRMYETMRFWEDAAGLDEAAGAHEGVRRHLADGGQSGLLDDAVRGQEHTHAHRTILRSSRGCTAQADQSLADLSIGGPEIASHALAADLVNELHVFVSPVLVGSGKPLPTWQAPARP